jgi:signal transduction histidine kinase
VPHVSSPLRRAGDVSYKLTRLEFDAPALYSRTVQRSPGPSPTPVLFLGLIITLVVVVTYSIYIERQIAGLRELQHDIADRNRKDSLQLLRIQNDLNSLALAMRDMLDNDEPYPLTAWSAQFDRIHTDLDDALSLEEKAAVAPRSSDQRQYLGSSVQQFWDYVMRANRQLFAQLAAVSEQRSDLAQKLIATQESTLHYISRELHDEFGQVLTAVGSMLGRAEKHTSEDSPLRADLREVREIAQNTLNSVRTLSQALHPVMLEEAGLESTLDWYLPTVEKQTGISVSYEKSGKAFPVRGSKAIHIYRIVQEALNNVARHSEARQAWVRFRFLEDALELEVEDHGIGLAKHDRRQGIGLVAMRERAELLNGNIEFVQPLENGTLIRGTLVRLRVPREADEPDA